jgi:hypothetical protein
MARKAARIERAAAAALRGGATPREVADKFGYTVKGARRLRSKLRAAANPGDSTKGCHAPAGAPPTPAETTAPPPETAARRTMEPDYAAAAAAAGGGGFPPPRQEQSKQPPLEVTPETVLELADFCLGLAVSAACVRYRVPAALPEAQKAAKMAPSERQMLSLVAPSIARRLPDLATSLDRFGIYIGGAMLCFITWQHVALVKLMAEELRREQAPPRDPPMQPSSN